MSEVKNAFDEVTQNLPPALKNAVSSIPDKTKNKISEIRLRAGCPLAVNISGMNMFVGGNDVSILPNKSTYIVSKDEVAEAFLIMCGHSVHAHADEIKNGFVTLKGGHRAGICGTAVYEGDEISAFREISSVNIRLSRQFFGSADPFYKWALKGNLLISGPTASGKTTVLRDLARRLSENCHRVTVIDSRFEIAGGKRHDLGPSCDILEGVKKSDGLDIAVRTLNPQYVILDELGDEKEVTGIISAMFCGVKVIASIHSGSTSELVGRQQAAMLFESGAIKCVAQLSKVGVPPEIYFVKREGDKFCLKPWDF